MLSLTKNQKTVSVVAIIVVILLIVISTTDKYEGVYSIDTDFASQADIETGVLYVGPRKMIHTRDCYLYIKKVDSVVEDQKVELSFGQTLSVIGSNNWPNTLSYKMGDYDKLTIYSGDVTYFVGFKDNALSYVAKMARYNSN